MRDYLVRAETKATWDAYALEQGWLVEGENGTHPAPHAGIDELGPVVIVPGTYDPETLEEITPPVMDNWHHVNLRAIEDTPEDQPELAPFAKLFETGCSVRTTHKSIRAIEGDTAEGTIQVLYPEDIVTVRRIWASGMIHGALPDMLPAATATAKKAKKTRK